MRFFRRKKKSSKTTKAAIEKWVTGYEDEETKNAERQRALQAFNKKFYFYILVSILYGLIFVNYIDIIIPGGAYGGYHLWLTLMYFFPFIVLTISFPRNWQLTIGLGLLASLMNDVFYGMVRNVMGYPIDLAMYYNHWLVPSDALLFRLNLGITIIPVYSWIMALAIYARVALVVVLLWSWRRQAKTRYLDQPVEKNPLATLWKKISKSR